MYDSLAGAKPEMAEQVHKDLRSLLDDYERKLILLALDATGGHQRRAAFSLGILPSTLSEKMKRLGLRQGRSWRGLPEPVLGQTPN
jgi:DNA-binding NtrC family response regulator